AIPDTGSIVPEPAGILDIIADREEARYFATLEAPGRAEHPGAVTDGRQQLPLLGRLGDQIDHRRVSAHVVGGIAAGDDHTVEVRRLDLAGGDIRLGGIAMLRSISLAGLRTDDLNLTARLAKPQDRIP